MEVFIVIIFIIRYAAITIEHQLHIDKLVPALLMMGIAWTAVSFGLPFFADWFYTGEVKLIEGFFGLLSEKPCPANCSSSS